VCVTEAPAKSGALITAWHAFEQGRDVFAVAGDMITGRSAGTDQLIKRGAKLVTSAAEILEEYLPRFGDILDLKAAESARSHPQLKRYILSGEEQEKPKTGETAKTPAKFAECPDYVSDGSRRLFSFLDGTPKTMDELTALSGLATAKILTSLTELELAGCVRRAPGQTYARMPI
jgi:DNA processing protein